MFRRLAVVAALLGLAGGAAVTVASSSGADPTPAFEATFDTPADLALFNSGWSGLNPLSVADGISHFAGDHALLGDGSCDLPTTARDARLTGTTSATGPLDFSQLLYWCGPPGAIANGHLMTTFTTLGYNHLWFSPKPTFTGITKVCYDTNETFIGGEWTEVQFVDNADAHRYPAGAVTQSNGVTAVARGTGGFDLGYTTPEFRQGDVNNGIFPGTPDTLVGLQDVNGQGVLNWFAGGHFTQQFVGWPGISGFSPAPPPITDEATRYKHCVENGPNNTVIVNIDSPSGHRTETLPGQIPQDERRVVFHHAGYDPPKRSGYDPQHITWHWDNIQVFAAGGTPGPPTTTTAAPTSVAPTTTTAALSACPSSFTADELAWCETVEQRLTALGG